MPTSWVLEQLGLPAERFIRIDNLPLQSLTPEPLDRLYRELETQGKRAGRCATAGVTCREHGCSPDRHGGLAPKTVRNVHGMLHRALQEAAERGHVPRNVASLAHVRDNRLHAAWRLAGTVTFGR